MKLRIKGNSIRLRLGRSEVEQLASGEPIVETTTFDPAGRHRLEYRLVASPDVAAVVASFEDARLVVRVPTALAASWGASDRLGIEATQPTAAPGGLRILIEKDLECLDAPPGESQADAYARPADAPAC